MFASIPVYITPSHVYLSEKDQEKLFGVGRPMTIATEHILPGQFVYTETVRVKGKLKRNLDLKILGPNWSESFVVLTPTESAFLGIQTVESKIGELENASPCSLIGPIGIVELNRGVIIPKPHITCSPVEADKFGIKNGDLISLDIIDVSGLVLEDVLVRVHPTFKLCVEIHQDIAREFWITRGYHARIR
ncbi:hypothetical protein KJ766_01565 [Patescibacteria group bacterium]|nr:hypothetical protein [Patescibacteria group bacterium]